MGQIQELYNKINNASELTLSGDFDTSDFKQVKLTSEKQITALEAQLPEINLATRNIDETLNIALSKLYTAHNEYKMYNTTKKRMVIGGFYPDKLMYDGVQHRTARPNEIILNISLINKKLRAKKNWTKDEFSSLSSSVVPTGIEPVTHGFSVFVYMV